MADILPIKPELVLKEKSSALEKLHGEDGLYVRRSNDIVYVIKTFKAERIPRLSKATDYTTKNMQKARRQAQELILAHRMEHLGHDGSVINRQKVRPIREIIERALDEHTSAQRFGTQDNHRYYFGRIGDRFGDKDVDSWTVDDFNKWILELRKTPVKRRMRNGEIKTYPPRRTYSDFAKYANVLMNFARSNNLTKNLTEFPNPDKKIRKIIEQKKREEERSGRRIMSEDEREIFELQSSRVMTRREIDRMFEVLKGDTRDQFILAFTCIMRLREAIEAPWSEIDLDRGIWSLPPERVKTGSKTGEGRSFFLSPEALEMLRRRKAEIGNSSRFVFPGYSQDNPDVDKPVNSNKRAWSTAKEKAGIKTRLRWHDIRHTALTFSILGDSDATPEQNKLITKDPFKVAKYAGVSLKTIEAVYLHTKAEQTKDVSSALTFKPVTKSTVIVRRNAGEFFIVGGAAKLDLGLIQTMRPVVVGAEFEISPAVEPLSNLFE